MSSKLIFQGKNAYFTKMHFYSKFDQDFLHNFYKNLSFMKPCHICEKIVRTQRSIRCETCKKIFCYHCITKNFPQRASQVLGKRENESFTNIKIGECFACIKECKCHKCKAIENVVYFPSSTDSSILEPCIRSLVSDEQLIPQNGLFRGRKVSEMPVYLQRIYLKKKVLYSKHEISGLSNDKNIPEQQNAQQNEEKMAANSDQKQRKQDESGLQNMNQQQEAAKREESADKNDKNQMQQQEEQADDYESEFPSRRAEHLHNRVENSAINNADVEDQAEVQAQDPNNENEAPNDDSQRDENAENEGEMVAEQADEQDQDQNNRSSMQQAGQ